MRGSIGYRHVRALRSSASWISRHLGVRASRGAIIMVVAAAVGGGGVAAAVAGVAVRWEHGWIIALWPE